MPAETDSRPSIRRLHALQRAWCLSQPFHNLELLAASGRRVAPIGRRQALARCAAHLGGPCHVLSWGFLTHLRRSGFAAHLSGATVQQPDDHLLVVAQVEGHTFVCDVGNGQPYLAPFPLDREHRQSHLGWEIRSRPAGDGLVIERCSPDQPEWRTVYRATVAPRRWDDFSDTIHRHHREPAFGPFLRGLRVVRIGATEITTVRDAQVTTYRDAGFTRRTLTDDELVTFIAEDLELGGLPVQDAVTAWRQNLTVDS